MPARLRAVFLLAGTMLASPAAASACLPPVMLWAWERPDDLSGLEPGSAGIAYLAKTLIVSAEQVVVRPRRQPLRTTQGAVLVPVVRIEAPAVALAGHAPAILGDPQRDRLAAEIAALARPGTPAVQIDFDAARSQRAFYRDLLIELRGRLPADAQLIITALASWTLFDDWLADLPIDEAVPMLFRMGVDAGAVRRYLRAGGAVRATAAQASLGIATSEPITALPAGRRVWVFNDGPWTPQTARTTIGEVSAWQGRLGCG